MDANCYYSAVGLARRFSKGDSSAYQTWFKVLIQKSWSELKEVEAVGTLNDATILPSLALRADPRLVLQALQQFGCQVFSANGQSTALNTVIGLGRSGGANPYPIVGAIALAVGVAAEVGLLLGINALSSQGVTTGVTEFRLSGFDKKVNTLAEHLAKLLEQDVAGHPPSYPNPERDPDKGWCDTIRRIIEEIDNAGYSQKQLNRDIEQAGISMDNWNLIREAVKEVIKRGLCSDYWGGFGGGSFAS